MALAPSDIGPARETPGWAHVRLSAMVPIGIIVVVAILCVVAAVAGSAQRADEVALDTEHRLFAGTLALRAERVLRETEAVATTSAAYRRIRVSFDAKWVQAYVGQRLQSFYDHDFSFIAAASDQILYASFGKGGVDPYRSASVYPDVKPILDLVRDPGASTAGAIALASARTEKSARLDRVVRVQSVLGRPAIVAAVAVTAPWEEPGKADADAPIVLSAKFIDQGVLARIASRLSLRNLRIVVEPLSKNDHVFDFTDKQGHSIAKFAWTPTLPGAEIVRSVVPFIIVALAGFGLLTFLTLRNMRGTAATIAVGESRLRHLALHDPLCGLPNRTYFSERLEALVEKVRKGDPPAAVFYIDLDHFKDVNDTLGHPIGDELIRVVTQRLTHALRADDLVARLGGDEFAIITSADCDKQILQATASRLIAALCAPYCIGNQTVVIGASIGIAIIHEHVAGAADIMRHADMALYRAKNDGRSRACIYDTAMDSDLLKRKQLENDLRSAIEKEELYVAYQPIVNNSGETVVGVEALCRWMHPVRGEIPPLEFIPIAEASGLIVELGEWVLRRACLEGNAWPGICVSVNVSPLQFRRADFVDVVQRILSETEFDATRLDLEVTESTLLGNVETAEVAMSRLKSLGVRLTLDDFGTGYSSLLYLRRFPFDRIKIDRSFVLSIERAVDAAAIVHAVVSLGRGLGMKVTAEGVETAEQHLFLRAAGVHSLQGYRFGYPGPAADISLRLASPGPFRIADDVADLAMAG